MLGPKQEAQGALFYEFSIDDHVPQDHLLRSIDRFVDLGDIRQYLAEFYSHTGRPSIDPELLIRMLLVGLGRQRNHLGNHSSPLSGLCIKTYRPEAFSSLSPIGTL